MNNELEEFGYSVLRRNIFIEVNFMKMYSYGGSRDESVGLFD